MSQPSGASWLFSLTLDVILQAAARNILGYFIDSRSFQSLNRLTYPSVVKFKKHELLKNEHKKHPWFVKKRPVAIFSFHVYNRAYQYR